MPLDTSQSAIRCSGSQREQIVAQVRCASKQRGAVASDAWVTKSPRSNRTTEQLPWQQCGSNRHENGAGH
jgi:hypothetical protein